MKIKKKNNIVHKVQNENNNSAVFISFYYKINSYFEF